MTRSSGLRSSCCKAGRPRDAPLSAPAQGKLPLPPGPVLQAFLAAGGSDVTICVPRTPFQSGGPSRIEPRWPPGAEPPCVWRGETSRTPRGGLETSSQAFQDTCVLFFFFSFHYHSHSGESKHEQTNPTTTRRGADREGKATSMYMFSCSGRTDGTAASWDGEEPFPRGAGAAAAGLSQRLAVTSLGGSGGAGGSVVLPWGPRLPVPVPPLGPGQPSCRQLSSGRGPGPLGGKGSPSEQSKNIPGHR